MSGCLKSVAVGVAPPSNLFCNSRQVLPSPQKEQPMILALTFYWPARRILLGRNPLFKHRHGLKKMHIPKPYKPYGSYKPKHEILYKLQASSSNSQGLSAKTEPQHLRSLCFKAGYTAMAFAAAATGTKELAAYQAI